MAQHDYVIANQGFPAFRSDLNDALAAIVSNNSGATEPTTMFAHQIWVDTAANPSVLKIRNADNDAWITIGSIDQTGDTFTMVNLKTSGPVVFNDAGADVDFRVEGDTDANLLFVDASADAIGIGTSSPGKKLDILSNTSQDGIRISGSSNPRLTIIDTTNSVQFDALCTDTEAVLRTDTNHPLAFSTNGTEAMRIDSSGNLLVGLTTAIRAVTPIQAKNTTSDTVGYFNNTNASPYGVRVNYSASPNGTDNWFLYCDDGTTVRFVARSNGGLANYSANDVNLSDRREKTNFAPAGEYLSKICAIPVQTFNYIDQSEDDPGLTLGVVAQDVQEVAPEFVVESNWGTQEEPKMRLSIYQTDFQYALMKCIQELKAELDTVKAELATLKG